MTENQVQAIKCAYADLIGALETFQNGTYDEHDWKAHQLSIKELKKAFKFLD